MTPLDIIALRQKVGQEDADKMALPLLIYFDAAKRGVCPDIGINFITKHLICALYLGQHCKVAGIYEVAMTAYEHLHKATARPGQFVQITTGEYQALRAAIALYLRVLPRVEVGQMASANLAANKMMGMAL